MAEVVRQPYKRIDALESALKIIRTWAAFDANSKTPSKPRALTAADVINTCDKALKAFAD